VWVAALSAILAVAGRFSGHLARLSTVLLPAACALPVTTANRNVRGAFLLVGVPWLSLFASRSLADIGHVTRYSADDWLTYQLAGARIYMGGFWLEGGSATFDYQPFYRWISGALHVLFGDSSVGELYFDAACVLGGALLAFEIARRSAGFRGGTAA